MQRRLRVALLLPLLVSCALPGPFAVASAAGCGVSGIADRFPEAAALCGTQPSAAAPAPPTVITGAAPAPVVAPAPVSVTMSASRVRLAQAKRAVRGSGRAPTSALIVSVARRYRIDPHLLASIVHAESGGRVDAVSNKGALGLMQVMPATARSLGVRNPQALRHDPVLAMTTGAAYLKTLQARFGNRPDLVVAAYNAGPGAVQKARNRVPAYRETRGYVRTVMGRYAQVYGARYRGGQR